MMMMTMMPRARNSFRPTTLLVKVLVVFVFYLTLQQSSCDSQSDLSFSKASQVLVAEKLKENFLRSNLRPDGAQASDSEMSESLRQFQRKLLRLRNSNCSKKDEEEEADFFDQFLISRTDSLNSSRAWRNASESWRSLDKSMLAGLAPGSLVNDIAFQLDDICLDSAILARLFNSSVDGDAQKNYDNLFQLVLTQLDNSGCDFCDESKRNSQKASVPKHHTWGYGILLVTIISASSLCGALVIPFSKKNFYKKVLMFLIALAVGSLAGSGFLHLIPQAFGITEDDHYAKDHNYVWKGLVMMGGVYLFYVVEKVLKLMILRRKALKKSASTNNELYNRSGEEEDSPNTTANAVSNNQQMLQGIGYVKTREKPVELSVEMRTHLDQQILNQSNERQRRISASKDNHHGHSHFVENLSTVEPVAWMIIFGDGLHNFIDGLSIGAAFTDSVIKGISISLAVICEEFPHELGDFAILINAGMSFKTALLFNFLSACSCYIGLAVGIVLGDNLGANQWIYAIAGGMFLYISLCDMIPELNELGDEIEKDFHSNSKLNQTNDEERTLSNPATSKSQEPFDLKIKLKILVIQNIGIIVGFSFMLIMAIYSGSISL